MKDRCARCGKAVLNWAWVLWHGPNGFRRYKLCVKCYNEIGAAKAAPPKSKSTICGE